MNKKATRGRGRPRNPSVSLPPHLVARYVAGELNADQVSELSGVNRTYTQQELRRLGVMRTRQQAMMRVRGRKLAPLYERIRQLRTKGLTYAQIGEKVGRSTERVRQIITGETGHKK